MMHTDAQAFERLEQLSSQSGISLKGAAVRRSSSRFCFGVEHGDYNGTELFGVGTDRFIWFAYKPAANTRCRLYSGNFPNDGVVEFDLTQLPPPKSVPDSWARFAYGAFWVLHRAGYALRRGIEGVLVGNIPGGGMSRSASLSLNLILSILAVNEIAEPDKMKIVDLAQELENDYIGSPCGKLDQIMILFAKAGMGAHYRPKDRRVEYAPLGKTAKDFRIVVMDTGTVRPGLEKSTYKIRRAECQRLVEMARAAGFDITCLADIKDPSLAERIAARFADYPELVARMRYIYGAQQRFYQMLSAWKSGDIETVGSIFRQDGLGLRDEYAISGPELETMCDIARTVPGVLGERMLGGGDKGAAGALVLAKDLPALEQAVSVAYPRSRPAYADRFAVHSCSIVDGIAEFERPF